MYVAKEKVMVPLLCVTCRAKFVKQILGYNSRDYLLFE